MTLWGTLKILTAIIFLTNKGKSVPLKDIESVCMGLGDREAKNRTIQKEIEQFKKEERYM